MDTALLAFDVDGLHQGRLVRPFDALAWMEALDAALARLVLDQGASSSCFVMKTAEEPLGPTPHSTLFLPISHDARHARVDHVLIHAPSGFDKAARKALEKLWQIEGTQGTATIFLVDVGPKKDFEDKVEHFGQSKVWQSKNPFVSFLPDRDIPAKVFEQQVRTELTLHGFPRCTTIDVAIERGRFGALCADEKAKMSAIASQFKPDPVRFPTMPPGSSTDASPSGFSLRLQFEDNVAGPIALGRWARHGMGQFLPG
jgi:hypothetical protein